MAQIILDEGAAPATPATGKVTFYAKTDGLPYSKDDAGTETALGGGPASADYLVKTANAALSAERVVTDGTSIVADWAVAGQVTFKRSALTGDVTASADGNATTIANDAVSNAKLRDSGALSVVGRSANSSGDPADITATATSDAVLRESGSVLGFGTVATAGIANGAVTEGKQTLADVTTLNASTSAHGYAPKATAPSSGVLSVLGIGNGETVRTDKVLFDNTNPEPNGTAAPGTSLLAARRDHVHAAGSSGGMQALIFGAQNNQPPASAYATPDTRNSHIVLDFDGATDEEAVFGSVLPASYAGGGLSIDTFWALTSATSGSLRVQAAIERIDESSLDIDADSFAAFQSNGGTAPSTSGQVIKVTVALTNGSQMDSLAAGEAFRLKIRRDADGTSGTDDITTDAELLRVLVRETT